MESLFLLVPVSVLLIGLASCFFVWAVRAGQFDGLDEHGLDVLDGDEQ